MNTPNQPDQAKEAHRADETKRPCPGCAEPISADATRCPRCGLAFGEHQRCYQCHSIAPVEKSLEARFVCSVCGAVRIPIDDPAVERSAEELDHLTRATAMRSAAAVWRLVASVVGAFGLFSAMVLWLAISFAHPPPLATVVAAMAALVPFVFAAWAWQQSRLRGAEFRGAIDKAWIAGAADIARARGGALDATELAKLTRIEERDADKLLAGMSAASLLTSAVTPDGSLKYTLLEPAAAGTAKPLPATR